MGRTVTLRPFSEHDLPLMQQWFQDPELREMTGQISAYTPTQAKQWYRELSADPDRLWFIIITKKGNRVIGEAGLLRMVTSWKCTDMGIIIGEKNAWRQGYGTDTGRVLLKYVFDILRFHRIGIGVVGFHVAALRFWEQLGFKNEGVWRDGYYCDNQYSDFIMMSILEEEYRQKYHLNHLPTT
jgi:RimJ/RimL family protein N-acetyltransferase